MNRSNPTGYCVDDEPASLFNLPHDVDAPVASVHKHATDTEQDAAEKISVVAGTLRARVLDWIIEAGDVGATGKELGARYALLLGRDENDGSARYSIMPRCSELRDLGRIRDSGRRRDGSIVWIKCEP